MVAVAVSRCIIFSLTAKGVSNDVVCRATLVLDVAIFCHTTLAIQGVVICCSTRAMHREHINHLNEGHVGKGASIRGKATSNNQPVQRKDKRAAQHKRKRNVSCSWC
jgi:hypothetical protein